MTRFLLRYGWLVLIAAIYVIIAATRGQWSPIDWFKDKPGIPIPGSGCTTAAGNAGMYDKNGNCIQTATAGGGTPIIDRIIISGAPSSFLVSADTPMPVWRYGCTYGNPRYWRIGWNIVFKLSCP